MRRFAPAVVIVALCVRARADDFAVGSPRSIARAGTGTVGDDGGGALLVNPAAIARRDTTRIQLGVAFIDNSVDFLPDTTAPVARNQAGSSIVPLGAIEAAVGDWVFGGGVMTSAVVDRALASPGSLPPDQLGNRFQYRYTGIAGSLRRDTITAGIARRLGDAIAIGVSGGLSRVGVAETRRIWAGFAGTVKSIPEPTHDVDIALAGVDNFVPSAVAGILVAPPDTRIELGASIAYSADAHADGDVAAAGAALTSATTAPDAHAHLLVREPLGLRTGVRWAGERWIGEVDGELWLAPSGADAATWAVRGISVSSGSSVFVTQLPSRLSSRTHGGLRGAVDVELIAGYLWATAGYAFTTDGTSASRQSATFGQIGGHTAALGLETTAGGFTITLGWAHTWSIAREIPNTSWRLDNPFGAGDAAVPLGRYDASMDLVGISLDTELGASQ